MNLVFYSLNFTSSYKYVHTYTIYALKLNWILKTSPNLDYEKQPDSNPALLIVVEIIEQSMSVS